MKGGGVEGGRSGSYKLKPIYQDPTTPAIWKENLSKDEGDGG